MRITAGQCRAASMLAAAVFALPLGLGTFTGLYLWTSPLLFVNRLLAGHGLVWFNTLTLAVLAMAWIRRRWYCRWVCPAGVLCDTASKARLTQASIARVPEIGRFLLFAGFAASLLGVPLLSLLDPVNLFSAFCDGFQAQPAAAVALKISGLIAIVLLSLLVPHLWCGKLCPLGALQDMLCSMRRWIAEKFRLELPFNSGRRVALAALAGFGVGLAVKRGIGSPQELPLRPPGALPAGEFETTCIRCGSCGRACPTDIIGYAFDLSDVPGLLTPRVSFASGYCLPECAACGRVCSSGAIQRFSSEEKKKLVIGVARIQLEGCRLTKHRECDQCVRYCAFDAVKIRMSASDISAWPEIVGDKCVGCGACMVVCPEAVISIVPAGQRQV